MATNYDDVRRQLTAAGLIIDGELRIGTPKPVRVSIEGGDREKRGWYSLKEWSPSVERSYIVGSFGVWRGNDCAAQKIELSKADGAPQSREQLDAMRKMWADDARKAQIELKRTEDLAARRAQLMWGRLSTEGLSPYAAKKSIVPDAGVKYTPNAVLVVPLRDIAGQIRALKFIRSAAQAREGKRRDKETWPKGCGIKGTFHLVGHDPDWIVLVAEGYATAMSLHAATGHPVVFADNAGNLRPVAENLRKRWKRAHVLICADDDCWSEGNPGVMSASTAALAVGGAWVKPTFADEEARQARHAANGTKITDFNDLHVAEGLGVVSAQIASKLGELGWAAPERKARGSSADHGGGELRPLQSLDDLLSRFSTIYGGKEGVFDAADHALVTETDVRNLCARSEMFRAWKEHADRRIVRIEDVGFDPAGLDPKITCNLWGGWPTEPKAGSCELILGVLRHMCSTDRNPRRLYEWVLRWLAYPLQHPGAKMKTTVVVHGPQGSGKNTFFEEIMAIYGKYGRILDQDALIDKHNDWSSRKLFLIADEVVAQAQRFEVKNKLKTLITGNWIRINPKHVAAYDEANHVNIVFLSNEQMPVVLEEDDRRHCVIYTPEKRSSEYYAAVRAEIAAGGTAALHDYLLHLDLGDFNPGTPPPDTDAKQALVDLAQDSPVDFVDALVMGDCSPLIAGPGLTMEWYDVYRAWCRRTGVKPASVKRFVNLIDHRRKYRSERKGYLDRNGAITNPKSMLLFGYTAPDGVTESTWLGTEVERMRVRKDDWTNLDRTGFGQGGGDDDRY